MAVAKIKTQTVIKNERVVCGRYLKIRHVEDPLHVSVAASFVAIGMQHEWNEISVVEYEEKLNHEMEHWNWIGQCSMRYSNLAGLGVRSVKFSSPSLQIRVDSIASQDGLDSIGLKQRTKRLEGRTNGRRMSMSSKKAAQKPARQIE
jgi:hypothetical protein